MDQGLAVDDLSRKDLRQAANEHLVFHFSKQEPRDFLIIERGEGHYVFDSDGNRYIDALSSLFCAQLGYSYGEEMANAVAKQMATLPFHTNRGTAHPVAVELAQRLADLAPGDLSRVLFTSGGAEAVEAGWKVCREYHLANGEPQRLKAIARDTAFHGVTLGALSLTGVDYLKEAVGSAPIEVARVSNTNTFRASDGNDPDAFCARLLTEVEAAILSIGADEVALIIAEPIQNAGGCLTSPPGYWRGLRRLADRYGALLMADEIISGFGRVGEWFAVAREGVAPDLVSLAKGLTSAYAPMGALIAAQRVVAPIIESDRVLRHGNTFGGHPLCAAVAMRNIEIFERDGVLENVRALAPGLEERLRTLEDLPIVGDVRGEGFFWALELVKDGDNARLDEEQCDRLLRSYLPARLREAGLIARVDSRGDPVVQIAPHLTSDEELLDEIADRLTRVLIEAARQL